MAGITERNKQRNELASIVPNNPCNKPSIINGAFTKARVAPISCNDSINFARAYIVNRIVLEIVKIVTKITIINIIDMIFKNF